MRALTNASGIVTDTYAYDAFGNTTHGLGSSPNPYQFNGQALDSTGLYLLRARYYNPGDGRFLSSTIQDEAAILDAKHELCPALEHCYERFDAPAKQNEILLDNHGF